MEKLWKWNLLNGSLLSVWRPWCKFLINSGHETVDSSWNLMAHGDAREGKWRGNWRMQWIASTLHTTSENGVFNITTADAHTSTVSSRLNWRSRQLKWTRPFRRRNEYCLMRVCHHISTGLSLYNGIPFHVCCMYIVFWMWHSGEWNENLKCCNIIVC